MKSEDSTVAAGVVVSLELLLLLDVSVVVVVPDVVEPDGAGSFLEPQAANDKVITTANNRDSAFFINFSSYKKWLSLL